MSMTRQERDSYKKLLHQRDEARTELQKFKDNFDKTLDIRTEAMRIERDLRINQQQEALAEADRLHHELFQAVEREAALEERLKASDGLLADLQKQVAEQTERADTLQAKLDEEGVDRLRKRLHKKAEENDALQKEIRSLKKQLGEERGANTALIAKFACDNANAPASIPTAFGEIKPA